MTRPRLTAHLCLALAAALLLCGGCLKLGRDYPEKRYFRIQAARPDAAAATAQAPVLRMRRFSASPGFAGRQMVYRTGDMAYETDFYNELLVGPADMIGEEARRWLAASGMFSHVVDAGSQAEARHVLEGNVVALYGDFRDAADAHATLKLQFFMVEEPSGAVVYEGTFGMKVPLERAAPDALAGGWSKALAQALSALEQDLRELELRALP